MGGGRADGTAPQPSRQRRDRRRPAADVHLTAGSIDWYVGRGAGIAAYAVLTFVVCAGLAMSGTGPSGRWRRLGGEDVRRRGALILGWLVALHVLTIAAGSHVGLWPGLGIVGAGLLGAAA